MDKMQKIEELRSQLLKLSDEELLETVEYSKHQLNRYNSTGGLRFDFNRITKLCKSFTSTEEMILKGNVEEKAAGRYIVNKLVDRNVVAPHFKHKLKTKEEVINYIEQGIKDGSIIKYRDIARQGGANEYTLKRLDIKKYVQEKYFGYNFIPKPKKERVRGKYTLEYSIEIASTFKSKTEMSKKCQMGYHQLRNNNLLDVYFPKKIK
jgi:hypothetical protein